MSDPEQHADLDIRLRDVPVPPRLVVRLNEIAMLSDRELDVRLRDVSEPDGLVDWLKDAVLDAWIEERLCDVDPPPRVLPKVNNIPYVRRRSHVGRLALAASLLVMLGAGYVTSLAGMLSVFRSPPTRELSLLTIDTGPLQLETTGNGTVTILPHDSFPAEEQIAVSRQREPEFTLIPIADRVSPGPAGRLAMELGRNLDGGDWDEGGADGGWNPWQNWMLLRWAVLGYAPEDRYVLPQLASVPSGLPHGSEPSITRGCDREFFFTRGGNAPVFPAWDASLRISSPPLTLSTRSFDRTRQVLQRGEAMDAGSIVTEEFLAAMDYRLAPAPAGQLAVRTAAGPSVFNSAGAGLLQIGVRAGDLASQQRLPTHLVVCLDTSAAMRWNDGLAAAQNALARLFSYLQPEDRISLVVCRDEAVQVVEEARREDQRDVVDLLDGLTPLGGANLMEGIQQSVAAAVETESVTAASRRLVLITANHPDPDPAACDKVRQTLEEAASQQDLKIDIFDLRDQGDLAVWSELFGDAPGKAHNLRDADGILRQLREVLAGGSTLLASDVRLEVEFDAQSVVAYRLVGYDHAAFDGTPGELSPCEMHAGEETTALYEVWLAPNDVDDVANVRLRWTDATSGQPRTTKPQRISRLQFSTSFEGSAISLQAAAIAAETAERLRYRYGFEVTGPAAYRYHPKPRKLNDLRDWVSRVNPALDERLAFQRLVDMIHQADKTAPLPSSSNARSGWRGITRGQWRELNE